MDFNVKLKSISSNVLGIAAFVILAAGSSDSDTSSVSNKPFAFTESNAGIYCKSVIKKLLRDPDSYKYESAAVMSSTEALIKFRSKNGFGGYVPGLATCTNYKKNGESWFKAEMVTR